MSNEVIIALILSDAAYNTIGIIVVAVGALVGQLISARANRANGKATEKANLLLEENTKVTKQGVAVAVESQEQIVELKKNNDGQLNEVKEAIAGMNLAKGQLIERDRQEEIAASEAAAPAALAPATPSAPVPVKIVEPNSKAGG